MAGISSKRPSTYPINSDQSSLLTPRTKGGALSSIATNPGSLPSSIRRKIIDNSEIIAKSNDTYMKYVNQEPTTKMRCRYQMPLPRTVSIENLRHLKSLNPDPSGDYWADRGRPVGTAGTATYRANQSVKKGHTGQAEAGSWQQEEICLKAYVLAVREKYHRIFEGLLIKITEGDLMKNLSEDVKNQLEKC